MMPVRTQCVFAAPFGKSILQAGTATLLRQSRGDYRCNDLITSFLWLFSMKMLELCRNTDRCRTLQSINNSNDSRER